MKLEEFWSRLSIPSADACWLWKGGSASKAYPVVNLGGGVYDRPHRISYRIHFGESENLIRHTCENTRCANPAHLVRVPNESDFWSQVDRRGPDECWLWTGRRHGFGYGLIGGNGRAHRISWELANGREPGALEVCHSCDNPPCVNPSHLFLGTHADNMADRSRKLRVRERQLTPEQVQEIRRVYRPWCRTNGGGALARRFGVSLHVVHTALQGKRSYKYEGALLA